MGASSTSQKRKKSSRSNDIKTPITPVSSSSSRAIYSLTRTFLQPPITARPPSHGRRSIQVRSLGNITVLPSLHKCDQRNDNNCQHRYTTKEANHVGLHTTRLRVSQVATKQRYHLRDAVDQPIHDVGIESLLDM